MPQLLLLNPTKPPKGRPMAKKRSSRKGRSAAQRRNDKRLGAMARSRARAGRSAPRRARRARRSSNPIRVMRRAARRPNPAPRRVARRRRRNPSLRSIGGSIMNFKSYLPVLKDAAVMGAGAIAVDYVFSYVNQYLPVSVRKVSGKVGVGDAVKALLTVAIGFAASGPTRGLSKRAALGSLVVQMRDLMLTLVPAAAAPVNGLGFVTAGRVVPGMTGRVNSNMRAGAQSPLLSQWMPGRATSPLLSGPMGQIYATGRAASVRQPLRPV